VNKKQLGAGSDGRASGWVGGWTGGRSMGGARGWIGRGKTEA
jgi:hypothetical protein